MAKRMPKSSTLATRARRAAYRQQLRDPRWQQKRLVIFQRDQWACQQCLTRTKPLQVHHRYYRYGLAPWDYPSKALVTLCVDCHKRETKRQRAQKRRKARTKSRPPALQGVRV